MTEFQIGDKVTAIYKTGKYIGEITDIRPQTYLVRVLAVAQHPMQGDLHNPKEAEVSFFHERRALAFREQTNVPKQMVKPFDGEMPEYKDSLREAVDHIKIELSATSTEWAERSLQSIYSLEKDYFK
ncbi:MULTISPECIES: kinase-associated lipoprotein B [unclassified Bacillus (in: firmicutes)]|uniref:kinase-associated lipoprotein B n=1 Tax=unclassified Bacillus (in: firmicutes) TaxID=185979 RepID=UPI0008DF8068|nr:MULTISPECIES: kinase-associated lipoprotein B [unclassified Bacillus (in: firmicutes)]SFB12984.1 kinase-associated protein B [Bacillus sp. UNCCL13]SFQ90144.1 kinase-associated protein B [Bacillus sp. cl95]